MDPQQTWNEMLDAVEQKRWDDAEQLATDLHAWLMNKGCPPATIGGPSFGKGWHVTIATVTCLSVQSRVAEIRKLRRLKRIRQKRQPDS